MLNQSIEYITDAQGRKKSAVVPIDLFEALLEQLDDQEDLRLFDEAKASEPDFVPAEQVFAAIEKSRGQ